MTGFGMDAFIEPSLCYLWHNFKTSQSRRRQESCGVCFAFGSRRPSPAAGPHAVDFRSASRRPSPVLRPTLVDKLRESRTRRGTQGTPSPSRGAGHAMLFGFVRETSWILASALNGDDSPERPRVRWTEGLTPLPSRLAGHRDTPLGQQVLRVAEAETEAIRPLPQLDTAPETRCSDRPRLRRTDERQRAGRTTRCRCR